MPIVESSGEPRYGEIPYARFGERDVRDGLEDEEEIH
jgi:hypothetical protein